MVAIELSPLVTGVAGSSGGYSFERSNLTERLLELLDLDLDLD